VTDCQVSLHAGREWVRSSLARALREDLLAVFKQLDTDNTGGEPGAGGRGNIAIGIIIVIAMIIAVLSQSCHGPTVHALITTTLLPLHSSPLTRFVPSPLAGAYSVTPSEIGRRRLRNVCLSYLIISARSSVASYHHGYHHHHHH
jgi:hypothetical protein